MANPKSTNNSKITLKCADIPVTLLAVFEAFFRLLITKARIAKPIGAKNSGASIGVH